MHPCRTDLSCRSGRVVWGALRRDPRATEPNPELGVVEPETARNPGTIEPGTWTRGDAVEPKWRKLDERKENWTQGKGTDLKKGEGSGGGSWGKYNRNAQARKTQPCQPTRPRVHRRRAGEPEMGKSLRRIHGEQRWKRTGRKEGEKKPERNVAGTRARRRVEDRHSFQRTNRREPGREVETQKRGAIPVEAETTEELLGALESSTRGETGLRAGDEPDPAESAGGMLPHVQNPCCSHLVPKYGCGPFHQIINHCGAIRSADLSFEPSKRKPNHIISQSEIVVPN